MKYIRLYEYYSSFSEIDDTSFGEISKNGRDNFTDKEVTDVSNELTDLNCQVISLDTLDKPKILATGPGRTIIISKFKDEWYLILTNDKMYKCDQFYSLIDCVKSITSHT